MIDLDNEQKPDKKKKKKLKKGMSVTKALDKATIETTDIPEVDTEPKEGETIFDVLSELSKARAEVSKEIKENRKNTIQKGKVHILAVIPSCPAHSIVVGGHDFPKYVSTPTMRGREMFKTVAFKKERLTDEQLKFIIKCAKKKTIRVPVRVGKGSKSRVVDRIIPVINFILILPDTRSHQTELVKLERLLKNYQDKQQEEFEKASTAEDGAIEVGDLADYDMSNELITVGGE